MYCISKTKDVADYGLISVLKDVGVEILYAEDIDDLLDKLWIYGSRVKFIVVEFQSEDDLSQFYVDLSNWKQIKTVIFASDFADVHSENNITVVFDECNSANILRSLKFLD